jgi:hypothetical protein
MMIKLAFFTVDEVFAAMDFKGPTVLPNGHKFSRLNARLVLFKTKGTICVRCGTEGTFFALETHDENVKPHLNLYGVNARGKTVLFTKDHIIPKSKGGANALENYDTMCEPCNGKKGNKM